MKRLGRSLWLVLPIACGPVVATPDGSSDSTAAAQTDAADTTPAVTSSDVTTSTTSATSLSTTTTTSGTDDMQPKWDIGLPPDMLVEQCPVPDFGSADLAGMSSAGPFSLSWAWFALGGGGECPEILTVVFTPGPDVFLAGYQDLWLEGAAAFEHAVVAWTQSLPPVGETTVAYGSYHSAADDVSAESDGSIYVDSLSPDLLTASLFLEGEGFVAEAGFSAAPCPAIALPPCP